MEINKQQFNTWMSALRSGEFDQGTGRLQSTPSSFCCLGVACKVLVPEYLLTSGGMLIGGFAMRSSGAPGWLADINIDFGSKTGKALSFLNDSKSFTFDEIADLLEAVYIHKVLEER